MSCLNGKVRGGADRHRWHPNKQIEMFESLWIIDWHWLTDENDNFWRSLAKGQISFWSFEWTLLWAAKFSQANICLEHFSELLSSARPIFALQTPQEEAGRVVSQDGPSLKVASFAKESKLNDVVLTPLGNLYRFFLLLVFLEND